MACNTLSEDTDVNATGVDQLERKVSHRFSEPWEDSDVILVVEDEKFHVHRLILSMNSPVFKAMFKSQFKESTANEIPLPEKKASEVLDFLKQIYFQYIEERVEVTMENIEHLLKLSDEYQVKLVFNPCVKFLEDQLKTKANVMKILTLAELYNLDNVRQSCNDLLTDMTLNSMSEIVHLQDLDRDRLQSLLTQRIERLEAFLDELYPQFMGLVACLFWLLHEADKNTLQQCVRRETNEALQTRLGNVRESLPQKTQRAIDLATEKGASNWLTVLPLKDMGYNLNKGEFRDAVKLRYDWEIDDKPTVCVCGDAFTIDHAMICRRGGFIIQRHNELRDLEADLLKMVCNDVEIEPVLQELTGERLPSGANTTPDARLDIHARGFWEKQRSAFFDVRVCHPNADSYKDQTPKQIYRNHENEKKRAYADRVLQVEQGTFTPLVFTSTGGMGEECKRYHSRLAELIAAKKGEDYATTVSWIRSKVSFAILRSALICLRGSRTVKRNRNIDIYDMDFQVENSRTAI
ncbi:hypothetical protein ACROYT_G020730 [Oculina patagonica]